MSSDSYVALNIYIYICIYMCIVSVRNYNLSKHLETRDDDDDGDSGCLEGQCLARRKEC